MDTYIFISAIILLGLISFSLIFVPMMMGKPRKNWSMSDWISQLLQLVLLLPILGRIFGWW